VGEIVDKCLLFLFFFLFCCSGVWPPPADFLQKAGSGQEEAVVLMRGSRATLCCKCSGNNSALTCWQTNRGLNCTPPINEMLHYLNEKREEKSWPASCSPPGLPEDWTLTPTWPNPPLLFFIILYFCLLHLSLNPPPPPSLLCSSLPPSSRFMQKVF